MRLRLRLFSLNLLNISLCCGIMIMILLKGVVLWLTVKIIK